jgi:CheY-like chemotaxis protein
MATLPTTDTDWTLEISFEDSQESARLNVQTEVLIGRLSPDQAIFNGFDLAPFRGVELGVSRRHAMFRWEGNHLVIVDLNSDNGTILNGLKLQPEIPYRLSDGDTLYIGHLKTKIRLNTYIGQTTIRARKVEFDTLNIPLKGRGQRILVVEDDIFITKLYQRAFEDAGYTVQVCRDVVNAIRILNQHTPELIILDVRLPSIHGFELCRYVRRDTDYPSIPIIAASALSDEETIHQAMQAGADVYLAKPLNMKELVRIGAALIFKHENENPALHTKKLAGTASLDFIAPSSRSDTIVIFVDGQREPIGTVVEREVTLGRGSAGPQPRAYLDLGNYGAFDKGVSRVHAKIKRAGKGFEIEDLDSANGTFVNGHSLIGQESVQLKNGDEIRLGDLRMHIYMLVDTGPVQPDSTPA